MKILTSRAVLSAALLCMLGLTACKSVKESYAYVALPGDTITYDAYLSLDPSATPRPTVDDVIATLGDPAHVFDRDGTRRRLDYNAFSMTDELKKAEFHFDAEERLVKKELW